jgi:hypothetical protein
MGRVNYRIVPIRAAGESITTAASRGFTCPRKPRSKLPSVPPCIKLGDEVRILVPGSDGDSMLGTRER